MGNRVSFAPGEWYHCFSRGVDKRRAFENEEDYRRFSELLYLANSTAPIRRDNIRTQKVFDVERESSLVSIGAYALMPNHFHLLIFEREERGISAFMRKLGIAYAMYFNTKYDRIGNLFVKPFRSRHVDQDEYFQYCVDYIHLNPADVFDQGFKSGLANITKLEQVLRRYPYSSLQDFIGETERAEKKILGQEIFSVYKTKSFTEVLKNASEYWNSINIAR